MVNNKVCRACLSTKESFTYYLFGNVAPELFTFCTSVEIFEDDNLPKSMCNLCFELLNKLSEFKNNCIKSQDTLISFFDSKSLEDTIKAEPEDFLQNRITKLDLENEIVSENTDLVKIELDSEANYGDETITDGFNETPALNQLLKSSKKQKKLNLNIKSKGEVKTKRPFLYICSICNKKFRVQERFETHKLEHEGKKPSINCQPCKKSFKTWSGLKRHKDAEHTLTEVESWKCSICSKTYKNLGTLKIHMYLHEDKNGYMCDICGKECKRKAALKIHMETHRENRKRAFPCEYCGKKFYMRQTVLTHVLRRHKGRRFICEFCSFPFIDKYSLVKHLLVKHDGIKPFTCDICHKSYTTQSFLSEHKRTHSGERPYVCSFCNKGFVSKKRLLEHQRIHTGERPYKCDVCSSAFTQRGTLKRHMRVHNNITTLLTS